MIFLAVLGVIGLAAIGATVYAIAIDGYAPARTRDASFYRSTFDHAAFHAQASQVGSVPTDGAAPSDDAVPQWLAAQTLAAEIDAAPPAAAASEPTAAAAPEFTAAATPALTPTDTKETAA